MPKKGNHAEMLHLFVAALPALPNPPASDGAALGAVSSDAEGVSQLIDVWIDGQKVSMTMAELARRMAAISAAPYSITVRGSYDPRYYCPGTTCPGTKSAACETKCAKGAQHDPDNTWCITNQATGAWAYCTTSIRILSENGRDYCLTPCEYDSNDDDYWCYTDDAADRAWEYCKPKYTHVGIFETHIKEVDTNHMGWGHCKSPCKAGSPHDTDPTKPWCYTKEKTKGPWSYCTTFTKTAPYAMCVTGCHDATDADGDMPDGKWCYTDAQGTTTKAYCATPGDYNGREAEDNRHKIIRHLTLAGAQWEPSEYATEEQKNRHWLQRPWRRPY